MMSTLAGMSLAGGAVLALWLLASGALRNRLPARWHYRILKTSLFFFLVPVGRLLPLAGRVLSALRPAPAAPASAPVQAVPHIPVTVLPQIPAVPAVPSPPPVPVPEPFSVTAGTLRVLALVWAVGAAGVLAYKAFVYLRLRRRVFRRNRPVSSPEARLVFWDCKRQLGVRGMVELRENPAAPSPFAAGLLRPAVVIPAVDLEPAELRYLFLHELTHIRCGDLWVRFLAMLAQAIHWYNPLAYLLCRSIQTVSEQSCDERVACPLPPEERYVYGNVILKLAANAAAGSGDWAATLSTRESMERRLTRVLKTEKLRGYKRLLALALAIAILACGGGAALAARNPLPVSKEAKEPAHTVSALPKEEGTESETKGGEAGPAPGETVPITVLPTSGSLPAPTEEQVLTARKEALQGMSDQQIQKLTETVKTANLCLEQEYMYNDLFGRLEAPESLYWNYFHQTGEIQIAWAAEGHIDKEAVCAAEGLTEEEFYAKYGVQVVATNRYDAAFFISLFNALRDSAQNSALKAELQYLIDQTALARDTHEMEHVNNVYKKLHDLDYFLLRYGPADVGPYMQDTSTISKYYGTLGAFYSALAPAENPAAGETAGDGKEPDKPVTVNGTPSEAFLKELRAHFGASENTPVLFGDHELILQRGGTLLPDEEFSSYCAKFTPSPQSTCTAIYKTFHTKDSRFNPSTGETVLFTQEEYEVGNKALLSKYSLAELENLVNGEYPKNSRGETYGSEAMSRYVGYRPDLFAALGTEGEDGYLARTEIPPSAPTLPEDECPHSFLFPLYDSEHREIGKFARSCGGHIMEDVIAQDLSIDEAKVALAAGETAASAAPTYDDPSEETLAMIRREFAAKWPEEHITGSTPVLFGDKDLILRRGGTILPDNDPDSYRMRDDGIHKVFLDRNGQLGDEYLVGNKNAVDPRETGLLSSLTPDGDYPKNSRGESCGHMNLFAYVGYWPDLEYLAAYSHEGRPAGYIYSRDDADSPLNRDDPDAAQKPRTQTDTAAYKAWRKENPSPTAIPLYDFEGEIIGTYDRGAGTGVDISGMDIEDAKAAMEHDSGV